MHGTHREIIKVPQFHHRQETRHHEPRREQKIDKIDLFLQQRQSHDFTQVVDLWKDTLRSDSFDVVMKVTAKGELNI